MISNDEEYNEFKLRVTNLVIRGLMDKKREFEIFAQIDPSFNKGIKNELRAFAKLSDSELIGKQG